MTPRASRTGSKTSLLKPTLRWSCASPSRSAGIEVRWRYRFGEGDENSVRASNLMQLRDGKIVEALGYVKAGLRQQRRAGPAGGHRLLWPGD